MASAEQQINALVATATRLGLLDFTEVDDLNQAGRRKQMVGRIQLIFEGCMGVVTPTKFGKVPNGLKGRPEYATMLKCVELATKLWGLQAEADKSVREGDGDTVRADIEYIAGLLRSAGYEVKKAA